ncbi:MAG: glycosyltransferase [Flavobacteriales bacterium]|nr:glycosyltransferase [Flavobacteriales bacterium]MDW8410572.1 glycosyltransferase [Flavobacteriales bacterium]
MSVILPVYNAEAHLAEALQSLINQTYRNLEILVLDDGSTDQSGKVVASFQDNRIRYIRRTENLGLIATLNEGLELARGTFIARLDADDIADPSRIEKQVKAMLQHPQVGIVGSWVQNFGSIQSIVRYPVSDPEIRWQLMYRCSICHSSAMFRASVIKSAPPLRFDSDYQHAEDYELWTRIIQRSKAMNLKEPLTLVRHHEQSVSKKYNEIQLHNTLRIIQRTFSQFGIKATFEEIGLFRKFADIYFNFTIEELDVLIPFLIRVVESDKLEDYIRKRIGLLVWHLMLNNRLLSYQRKKFIVSQFQKKISLELSLLWKHRLLLSHTKNKFS